MRFDSRHLWTLDAPECTSPEVIGRLLEDGDAAELRRLAATLGEEPLAVWLGSRGGRQLSRRSRAFWELVLATASAPPHEVGKALWPL